VEHDQAHPLQHALVYAVDHRIVDLVMGHVPPPGQDIGVGENRVRQAVLRLVERRDADLEA
jgi:hypothetical protein